MTTRLVTVTYFRSGVRLVKDFGPFTTPEHLVAWFTKRDQDELPDAFVTYEVKTLHAPDMEAPAKKAAAQPRKRAAAKKQVQQDGAAV